MGIHRLVVYTKRKKENSDYVNSNLENNLILSLMKRMFILKSDTETHIYLNNIIDNKYIDKGLETIARKLLERLLIFFIDDSTPCPIIRVVDASDIGAPIILNHYINQDDSDIKLLDTKPYEISSPLSLESSHFIAKIFKVFYAQNQKSKICLTGHSREVTETTLQNYIPEFEDDFFEEEQRGKETIRRNYIVKVYVVGSYLNDNVSIERETFNFEKDKYSDLYPYSQTDIEKGAADKVRELFNNEVKVREGKKFLELQNISRLQLHGTDHIWKTCRLIKFHIMLQRSK